jgi:SAM-dependent methyltransferase
MVESIDGEIETIIQFTQEFSEATETYPTYHIDSPQRVREYVEKANEIIRYVPSGKVLDWGCGYGQMFFLLHKRGLDVTGCELSDHYRKGNLVDLLGLNVIYLSHSESLPFEAGSLDAALSCGVLEHVEDIDASIKEICRVLKTGAFFFIYNFPNRFSWTEFASRHLFHKGHEKLFGLNQTIELLRSYGLITVKSCYQSFLPLKLGFLNNGLRAIVDYPAYHVVDSYLSRTPLLKYFCQNITLICQKL